MTISPLASTFVVDGNDVSKTALRAWMAAVEEYANSPDFHLFEEQASAPATPASGFLALYAKTDKKFYLKDSAGNEYILGREVLSANRTYYVRTDGSDSHNGLANTSGGAFLTFQKAYNVIVGTLDLAGFTVTIQIGDGTYAAGLDIAAPWVGGGAVTVQGNSGTPANVHLSTSGNGIYNSSPFGGVFTVKDMKITAANAALQNNGTGIMSFTNIVFGVCGYHIFASNKGAKIVAVGNYAVVGAAIVHLFAAGGEIDIGTRTVTFTGSLNFAVFAVAGTHGHVLAYSNTWSGGTITGQRYDVNGMGKLYTAGGGANYFPGNSPGTGGTTVGGGEYV